MREAQGLDFNAGQRDLRAYSSSMMDGLTEWSLRSKMSIFVAVMLLLASAVA
jgi:hypothetical protein